eukprot:Lithocolla_globosa_v1_NODE_619_length_3582_cov_6.544088.p1 type:complete len:1116 gc:universal NODE_619_length_3582_cov_6.544088:232-3579(+)
MELSTEELLEIANKNLKVLQQRYQKLNREFSELQAEHALAGGSSQDHSGEFYIQLSTRLKGFYDNESFSDIQLVSSGQSIHAHKLVLHSRSEFFAKTTLGDEFRFPDELSYSLVCNLVQFIYGHNVDISKSRWQDALQLFLEAHKHGLKQLVRLCEMSLVGMVSKENCAILFKHAHEIDVKDLRQASLDILLNEFEHLDPTQLELLGAPLMVEIFEAKSPFPLHLAVNYGRNDVLFLFMLQDQAQQRMNTFDSNDDTPLSLALSLRRIHMAVTLVENGCDVTSPNPNNNNQTLLHQFLIKGDDVSASFLIKHGARINAANDDGFTALHTASKYGVDSVVDVLLETPNINLNAITNHGQSALHLTIQEEQERIVKKLVEQAGVNLNIVDQDAATPLWFSLTTGKYELAEILASKGCDVNVPDQENNTMLHRMIALGDSNASHFLVAHHADVTKTNVRQQTALHIAAEMSLPELCRTLLESPMVSKSEQLNVIDQSQRLPLHIAVEKECLEVVRVLTEAEDLNLDGTDSEGNSPLYIALAKRNFEIALLLLQQGANLAALSHGLTLLEEALKEGREEAASFLLSQSCPMENLNEQGQSALELALVYESAPEVVVATVKRGCDPNAVNNNKLIPLQVAFRVPCSQEVLNSLVELGADVNAEVSNEKGERVALLFKMIEEGDQVAAKFLINQGANLNVHCGSSRQTPLGLTAQLGLEDLVELMLSKGADVNAYDSSGQNALHYSVQHRQVGVASILLESDTINVEAKDVEGMSVFSRAFRLRDVNLCRSLLDHVTVNYFSLEVDKNNNGYTMLQACVANHDLDGVNLLLQMNVNLLERGETTTHETALHIAAREGHLDLAQLLIYSDSQCLDATTSEKNTPLHLAAQSNSVAIAALLLKNNARPVNGPDGNTPLHVAILHRSTDTAALLAQTNGDFVSETNDLGENCLHLLAKTGGNIMLLESMIKSGVDINAMDNQGNTALLIAYLCQQDEQALLLAQNGASLCIANSKNESVLDEVPTDVGDITLRQKALQRQLLATIESEPEWLESLFCNICQVKFTVSIRKHHCRHCGRVACSQCLPKPRKFPIEKFGVMSPVRLCAPCHDYLTNPAPTVRTPYR